MSPDPSHQSYEQQLASVKKAGNNLGRQVLVLLLNGGGNDKLIKAYYDWRDASIGKPNFGKKRKWSDYNG
jgi:hypothetical protein